MLSIKFTFKVFFNFLISDPGLKKLAGVSGVLVKQRYDILEGSKKLKPAFIHF